jgi:hypothetical protein
MTTATMVRQAGLGGSPSPRTTMFRTFSPVARARRSLTQDKIRVISRILSDEVSGFKRLGVGMIGPIQLKLRYQGITRNVLVEDPVTPGYPRPVRRMGRPRSGLHHVRPRG